MIDCCQPISSAASPGWSGVSITTVQHTSMSMSLSHLPHHLEHHPSERLLSSVLGVTHTLPAMQKP